MSEAQATVLIGLSIGVAALLLLILVMSVGALIAALFTRRDMVEVKQLLADHAKSCRINNEVTVAEVQKVRCPQDSDEALAQIRYAIAALPREEGDDDG